MDDRSPLRRATLASLLPMATAIGCGRQPDTDAAPAVSALAEAGRGKAVERIGDPIEAGSGSPRFHAPTLAVGSAGFVAGCEPVSDWASEERYAALFDNEGQPLAD